MPAKNFRGNLIFRIVPLLHEGKTIPEVAKLLGTSERYLTDVACENNLPRNRPIKPDSRREKQVLHCLVSSNMNLEVTCALFQISMPTLLAFIARIRTLSSSHDPRRTGPAPPPTPITITLVPDPDDPPPAPSPDPEPEPVPPEPSRG